MSVNHLLIVGEVLRVMPKLGEWLDKDEEKVDWMRFAMDLARNLDCQD